MNRGTGETIQMVDGMGPNFSDIKKSFPGEAMNFRTGSIPTDVLNFKSRYPLLTLKKE
jgi:hypothetical protein